MIVDPHVEEYIRILSATEDPLLIELEEYAEAHHVPIARPDARLYLCFMAQLLKPTRILEIGTAIAYSTIALAKVTPASVMIDTIERNDDRYALATANVRKANLGSRINLIHGDALEELDKLPATTYDLIFMDAAKGQYQEFFDKTIDKLSPNGLMICDNILQEGRLAMSVASMTRRDHTVYARMRDFLETLKNDPHYTVSFLTLGDGLALITKNTELKE